MLLWKFASYFQQAVLFLWVSSLSLHYMSSRAMSMQSKRCYLTYAFIFATAFHTISVHSIDVWNRWVNFTWIILSVNELKLRCCLNAATTHRLAVWIILLHQISWCFFLYDRHLSVEALLCNTTLAHSYCLQRYQALRTKQ